MAFESDLWLLIPRSVRRFPADLAAVVCIVALTCGSVLLPGLEGTPLRIVFGLFFVSFAPGYACIAALFPEARDGGDAESRTDDAGERNTVLPRPGRGIGGSERLLLSIGTSITVVPTIALLLNFTPWKIRLVPMLLATSGFTLIAAGIATYRREKLPANERFAVSYEYWVNFGREKLLEPDSRAELALNVALVLSLLLAVGSVTYPATVQEGSDSFTEFYLLSEDETGELVADDYPSKFTRGESKPLYVGIRNREHRTTNYTVVVLLQRVETANGTVRVTQSRELHRFHPSVRANETWRVKHEVTPRMTGERLRLQYLLYKGDAPPRPAAGNAYRELHLWVNVSASNR
ncbi:DUF1616 domain-containing protein [Haladaptatus salinisoli]|uniref:DUF1616 domain-containing protein n=1 Tax=Haladaptatus salinisoli TaxID=2884876 RepID=UPI001D0A053D|nr:DUF1616 domain-containing protein [Haladaptatus salinisoli]